MDASVRLQRRGKMALCMALRHTPWGGSRVSGGNFGLPKTAKPYNPADRPEAFVSFLEGREIKGMTLPKPQGDSPATPAGCSLPLPPQRPRSKPRINEEARTGDAEDHSEQVAVRPRPGSSPQEYAGDDQAKSEIEETFSPAGKEIVPHEGNFTPDYAEASSLISDTECSPPSASAIRRRGVRPDRTC